LKREPVPCFVSPEKRGEIRMSVFRMSGSGLYNAHHQLVAKARGESLFDSDNQRVGFIRGNTLFDAEERIMMSVRGSEIYDASDTRVASVSEVKMTIQGNVEDMMCTAMWYCFIR
jgi:hypothetical protein